MKSKNRIRQNGLTQPAKKQSKSTPAAPLPEPNIDECGTYSGSEPVSLLLHDDRVGGYIAGTDVSPTELKALRKQAKALDLSVGALLNKILEHATSAQKTIHRNSSKREQIKTYLRSLPLHERKEQIDSLYQVCADMWDEMTSSTAPPVPNAPLTRPVFDADRILIDYVVQTLPDSISQRRQVLAALSCKLTSKHPAWSAIQAEIALLEGVGVLSAKLLHKIAPTN